MSTNEEKFYNNCFTEIEAGKVNSKFNKTTMKCFDSEDNKFSMDCEGNLVVNSIITRELNNKDLICDLIYPIGSFYITSSNVNPSILFGGNWEQIQGRFLLGCGDNGNGINYEVNSLGGESNHALSYNEMPTHSHEMQGELRYSASSSWWIGGNGGTTIEVGNIATSAAGNGWEHNNMPPYLVVYMWKRVA